MTEPTELTEQGAVDPFGDQVDLAGVVLRREGRTVTARLTGELDMSNADTVLQGARQAADGAAQLVVDLSLLGFIDSAGIAALARLHRELPGSTALTIVAPPTSRAGSTLHLAGMDQVLPVTATAP